RGGGAALRSGSSACPPSRLSSPISAPGSSGNDCGRAGKATSAHKATAMTATGMLAPYGTLPRLPMRNSDPTCLRPDFGPNLPVERKILLLCRRSVPMLARDDLGRGGIREVVRRHDLHAVRVERIDDRGVQLRDHFRARLRGGQVRAAHEHVLDIE